MTVMKGAEIRGHYRYWLYRIWNTDLPALPYVMLNPSTADHEIDDPTIRKCKHFAERDGYGGIIVVNLFAYRATKPKDLLALDSATLVGPLNRNHIQHALLVAHANTTPIVAAWGEWGERMPAKQVAIQDFKDSAIQNQVVCLGHNKSGSPKHPCYLANDTEMELWAQ